MRQDVIGVITVVTCRAAGMGTYETVKESSNVDLTYKCMPNCFLIKHSDKRTWNLAGLSSYSHISKLITFSFFSEIINK